MNNTIIKDAAVRIVDNLSTLNTKTADLEREVAVLDSRMDVFTALPEGATTNDAALEDIKVGYDGTVYEGGPGDAVRAQVGKLSSEITDSSVIDYEPLVYRKNDNISSSLSYQITKQLFPVGADVFYSTNGKKYANLESVNPFTSIGDIHFRLVEFDSSESVLVRNEIYDSKKIIEFNENTVKLKLYYVVDYSITVNSPLTYGSDLVKLYLWDSVSSDIVEGFNELKENVDEWNNEFVDIKDITYRYGYVKNDGTPLWDFGNWYMTSGIIPVIDGETKVILSRLFTSGTASTIAFYNSFNVSKDTCIEYHINPTSNIFDIPKGAVCYVTSINGDYTDCTISTQHIEFAEDTRKDIIPSNSMMYCESDGTIKNIYNPYKNGGSLQLAGQMHSHAWQNDGSQPFTPQELLSKHESLGYDFMTITDYDTHEISRAESTDGMLFLFGSYECSVIPYNSDDDNGQHILVWNTNEVAKFPSYTKPQTVIDFANSGDKVASYAHPMLPELLQSDDKIRNIVNCRFIEVYNGLNQLSNNTSMEDNERAWNVLLSSEHFTFGMGVSDTHTLTDMYVKEGCIKVFCEENTRTDIWKNILDGNFYSCSNVNASINSISLVDDVFTLDIGANNTTEWLDENGNVLKATNSNISTYKISGSEKCVRARIHLTDTNYYVWTQPIFMAG